MLSRLELLVDLLHSTAEAALASNSVVMDGYPFASAVSFVTDAHHCPVILISSLAEHTRNITSNPRASLLITQSLGGGDMARVSLVGGLVPIEADALLVQRYLRYHPHAEQFLQLGDFRFYRLVPLRILTVGGFGKASWLEGQRLLDAPALSLTAEAERFDQAAALLPAGSRLLGLDAYGADLLTEQGRRRLRFRTGPMMAETLMPSFVRELAALGTGEVK